MTKKQIVKVKCKYDGGEYAGYAIALDENSIVLENGRHIDITRKVILENLFRPMGVPGHQYYTIPHNMEYRVREIETSATRNVPVDIRDFLISVYETTTQMIKLHTKYMASFDAYNEEMKERQNQLVGFYASIRESKGILTKEEFLKAFMDALSRDVKYAFENNKQQGYNGLDGEYKVDMYTNIEVTREVFIDKWAKPDWTYLEYDNTRHIRSGAENFPSYKALLKEYSRPLPIKAKMDSEYLTIGDKDSVLYECRYIVKIDSKKPLTKDYAEQLAKAFCER